MKCQHCGSELIFSNGLYVCTSCGSKFHPHAGLELVDVFIAYIETDATGHRTKDSVLCNEIYNELQNAKIKTFYERTALSNAWGTEYESALIQAFDSAKIVVLFGTNQQYFEQLLVKYREKLVGKKIFPVYADMDAGKLPQMLSNLQALNYGNIGASKDLKNNILAALGRGSEIDTTKIKNKKGKKIKVAVFSVISVFVVIGIISSLIIIFATPLVLPSKKFKQAQTLVEKSQYSDAIIVLDKIPQYENAENLLNNIYSQYSGYYQSVETNTGFHIVFWKDAKVSVEVTQMKQDGIVKITETAQLNKNEIDLSYNDSLNNAGNIRILLENDGLKLTIIPDSGEPQTLFFKLDEKSDKPFQSQITGDTIRMWLEKIVTQSEFNAQGHELIFEEALYKNTDASQYRIKNTDIHIALYMYDISITGSYEIGTPYDLSDELMAFGYSAPAELLIPDMIGESATPFVKDDIIYLPNYVMSQDYYNLDFYVPLGSEKDVITKDMQVCCTSKKIVGDVLWDALVKKYILIEQIKKFAEQTQPDNIQFFFNATILAENNTHYLVYLPGRDVITETDVDLLYKINKSTYMVEFVAETPIDLSDLQLPDEMKEEFPIMIE